MPRTPTLVLTVTLAAGLLGGGLGAASLPGGPDVLPEAAAQQQAPDLAAEWARQEEKALNDAAKEYEKLYDWCVKKMIENTGNLVRRKVFRYQPDHAEVRAYFGYERKGDAWVMNEIRREKLREVVDIEDPKATDFAKKVAQAEKKIVGLFKALANKAKKNSEEKTEAGNAAAWKERETRTWHRVLQVDSTNEEAHRSLNHPKFDGKYVTPFAMPFVKVRKERKEAGLARAKSEPATKAGAPAGLFATAGLTGGAAQSENFTICTSHGPEVAVRLTKWAERALEDFVAMYGVDASVKSALGVRRYDVMKDKDEHEKLLRKAGWDEPKIKKYLERFSGMSAEGGEFSAHNQGGADADDMVMHQVGHTVANAARGMAVAMLGSPNADIENWLEESIAYDITRRLTGTTLTTCGAFGKYGSNFEPKPNQDIWIELAKIQVENDDDVPLTRIWKLKLDEGQITGPVTVKGYAFLQFLFESDPEKARKFVFTAIAQGTPAAAIALEGGSDPDQALDALDAKYREWIMKSW